MRSFMVGLLAALVVFGSAHAQEQPSASDSLNLRLEKNSDGFKIVRGWPGTEVAKLSIWRTPAPEVIRSFEPAVLLLERSDRYRRRALWAMGAALAVSVTGALLDEDLIGVPTLAGLTGGAVLVVIGTRQAGTRIRLIEGALDLYNEYSVRPGAK